MTRSQTQYHYHQEPDGYISASPLPTQAELSDYYAETYYQAPVSSTYQESYDEVELKYKHLKCETLLTAFKQGGIDSGELLDIGAGEGFLMHNAEKFGFSVTGIDFSGFGVSKFFPNLKDRLITGDVYDNLDNLIAEKRSFSACSAINILEHVMEPVGFLQKARKLLKPGGCIAVTVPNDFSKMHQLLKQEKMIDRDFWFAPPEHLHYFNCENLQTFCKNNQFEVLDAFAEFPVDIYLLHPASNYILDPQQGKAANRARILHELLIAEAGIEPYLDYYRAMFKVGIGRNITVILRPISA